MSLILILVRRLYVVKTQNERWGFELARFIVRFSFWLGLGFVRCIYI